MPGWLERVISAIGGAAITAFLKETFGALRQKRIDQDQQQVGRQSERTAEAKAALEAEQRIKEAGAKPRDTQGDLDGGKF